MNGIETIKARIQEDSKAQCDALLQEAKEKAAVITVRYEEEAMADYEKAVSNARSNGEIRIQRMESVAQLEARKLRLAAKQEMLEKAFSCAEDALCSLNEEEYIELLKTLALKAVDTGLEELVFSAADRDVVGQKVVDAANKALKKQGSIAGLTLSEEARDFKGGLYVKNGSIETNCTFSALIRSQKEQMAQEVAQILFD